MHEPGGRAGAHHEGEPAQMGDRGVLPHHEERVPGKACIPQAPGPHRCAFHHMLHLPHRLQVPGTEAGQPVHRRPDHRHTAGDGFPEI